MTRKKIDVKYSCGQHCQRKHEHYSIKENPLGIIIPERKKQSTDDEVLL